MIWAALSIQISGFADSVASFNLTSNGRLLRLYFLRDMSFNVTVVNLYAFLSGFGCTKTNIAVYYIGCKILHVPG